MEEAQNYGIYSILVYKRLINKFYKRVEEFCKINEIPNSLNNLLLYKSKVCVGPGWNTMYSAPTILLAVSKSFLTYRNTLDPDFKEELITDSDIYQIQNKIQKSPMLLKWLRKKIKNDCIL